MIWCQIVEGLATRWCSVERTTGTCEKMFKAWILEQFDIKSCLPITFKDEWWNFHFDTSNSKTSKKVTLKTTWCESRHEIDQIFFFNFLTPSSNSKTINCSIIKVDQRFFWFNKLGLDDTQKVHLLFNFLFFKDNWRCTYITTFVIGSVIDLT